jgi:peptidoglycan/xylan/chitin deacetylase (PgdA/CDA1 family)
MVTAFPARGQQAPNFWDTQLKGYIDEGGEIAQTGRLSEEGLSATYAARHLTPDDPDYRQIPVVMLHQFTDANQALGVLKDYVSWGYEGIFYSEAMEYLRTGDASGLPEKPICFTDDDGGLSSYTGLFSALQQLGQKATYFIVPKWVNGDITAPPNGGSFLEASAFTWADAVTMQASGLVEFQSHTLTHGSMRALTGAGTFTADLSADGTGAGADFLAAKAMIEANVPGSNVLYNAAPFGVINEAAIESLKAAGCLGNRVTQCGKNTEGEYDGSGPFAYLLPSTDPFRVPIADSGNFKFLARDNIFGQADPDGNRFQNGKMLVSQRGITLATGFTFATTTLPDGTTGPALRGAGTAAATPIYHGEKIPVGQWGSWMLDFYVKAPNVPTNGARLALECFTNYTDAVPVRTLTDSPGYSSTSATWKRMRWAVSGYSDVAWVRPRFEIVGAAAASEAFWWDIRLRATRNPLAPGSPRPVA